MTDGVHGRTHAVQAAVLKSMTDGAPAETEGRQLPMRDHAMLSIGDRHDRALPLQRICTHIVRNRGNV